MKNSIFDYNSEDVRAGDVELTEAEKPEKPRFAPSKKMYTIAVAALSVILAVVLIFAVVNRVNKGMIMDLQVGDVLPYAYEDGEYTGSYSANGMGATVTVSVESGFIIDIALNGFDHIDTSRVERVFNAVIYAQSLVTYDGEVGTQPTDIILLLAIQKAFEGDQLT